MSVARIDMADPSPEGDRVADALMARGYVVGRRTVAELRGGSEASLILLGGDAEGAFDALKSIRTAASTAVTPVVVLGAPKRHADEPMAILGLGADAYYPRPVDIERLVRKIETFLGPFLLPRSAPAPEPSGIAIPVPRPLERTMELANIPIGRGDGDSSAPNPTTATPSLRGSNPADSLPPPVDDDIVPLPPRTGARRPGARSEPRSVAPESLGTGADHRAGAASASAIPAGTGSTLPSQGMANLEPDPVSRGTDAGAKSRPPGPGSDAPARPPSRPSTAAEAMSGLKAPERTMELDASAVGLSLSGAPKAPAARTGTSSEHVVASTSGGGQLSEKLRKMILDADRRVFPDEPPMDLRFPVGQEQARDLVPDDMLEMVYQSIESVEDDPIEAFTYIGTVVEHDPQSSRTGAKSVGGPASGSRIGLGTPSRVDLTDDETENTSSDTPATVLGLRGGARSSAEVRPPSVSVVAFGKTMHDLAFGDALKGGGRGGSLAEGELIRLLFRALDGKLDADVTLRMAGGLDLSLRIAEGVLHRLTGPVATLVVEQLRQEHRLNERPGDEVSALQILERRVGAGMMSRFDIDRRMRQARLEVVWDAIDAREGEFEIRAIPGEALLASVTPGAVLGRSLESALVEGARRRLPTARVRRLLGGAAVAVRLDPDARERLIRAELEPELEALLVRNDGAAFDEIIATAPVEVGVAGAVFALVAAGVARVVTLEGAVPDAVDALAFARETVDAGFAAAQDADYFAVLGVRPRALPRELQAAYESRRRALDDALRSIASSGETGVDDLYGRRLLAIEVLDEAYEVLSNDRLREAYGDALGPADGRSVPPPGTPPG